MPQGQLRAFTRSEMIPKLHLTLSSEKFVLFLLNQQFYCWGKDILSTDGNLLIETDFERTRAPDELQPMSSAYEKTEGNRYLCLWGLGLFCGQKNQGGLFLSRNKLPPLLSSTWKQPDPHWVHKDMDSLSKPGNSEQRRSMYTLLGTVFKWISKYEEMVLKKRGNAYRTTFLIERNLRLMPPKLMPRVWSELSEACEAESPYDSFRLIAKKYKPEICKPETVRSDLQSA